MRESRVALLTFLKDIGMSKLKLRQDVCNAIARTMRNRAAEELAQGIGAEEVAEEAPTEPTEPELPNNIGGQGAVESEPEMFVTPSDPHLWLTPCNWHVCPSEPGGAPLAVSACPGAYLRVRWAGGDSSADSVAIEVRPRPRTNHRPPPPLARSLIASAGTASLLLAFE